VIFKAILDGALYPQNFGDFEKEGLFQQSQVLALIDRSSSNAAPTSKCPQNPER